MGRGRISTPISGGQPDKNSTRATDDARRRIGHFIGFYNFQRTHQGIEGLVPADRYFEASESVRAALQARVAENAKELALHGEPRKPLYLTGRIGDEQVSLHTEGERVLLTTEEGVREEVDLKATGKRAELGPGESELDEVLEDLGEVLGDDGSESEGGA